VKRALLLSGALAAAAAGTLLLLFAVDVHRWQSRIRTDDAAYRTAPRRQDLWQPATILPASLSRDVLGLKRDIAYRRALDLFRRGNARRQIALAKPRELDARAEATVALSAGPNSDPNAARRSQALTLLGVLDLLIPTYAKPEQRLAQQLRAASEFTTAIGADPANEDAKFDLELALRLIHYQSGHGGTTAGTGGVVARGSTGSNGY
jgi:hypothetical protein